MSSTPAVAALTRAGIAHEVHRYRHDPRSTYFGDEAVTAMTEALGVDARQIFKTLVVETAPSGGGRAGLAVAIVPVPHKLSLKAMAAALGVPKVTMAPADRVTRSTGYVLGGVSPLGQKQRLPTVLDSSALDWPIVLCSAGRRGLEVSLAPADLREATGASVAPLRA